MTNASPSPSAARAAARIAGLYLIVGILWIALSDRMVGVFREDPTGITAFQTAKGWAFVIGSAVILYFVALRGFRAFMRLGEVDDRLGAVLDTIPAGVAWKAMDGRYLGCNARFAHDMGRGSPGDVVGLRDEDLPWRTWQEEVVLDERAILEDGESSRERRQDFPDPTGKLRRVRSVRVPLRDAEGRIAGVLVCYEDETDRRRAELQLRAAQRVNEVGTLASGVAHDFRNVLSVIIANADLIAEGHVEGEEARSAFADIRRAARSASGMIQKLLGFGRGRELTLVEVDLAEAIGNLAPMLSRMLTSSYPLRLEVEEGLPRVLADRDAVEHVLLNLITNARDSMPEGGEIRIRARAGTIPFTEAEDVEPAATDDLPLPLGSGPPADSTSLPPGPCVVLSVSDQGRGIAPEHLGRIFEPFFTTKAADAGTGLGLAMVLSIVHQHGGSVQVFTALGRGTAVRLLFPTAPVAEPLPVPTDEGSGGFERENSPSTLLVVEDQDDLRRTMVRVLERGGYRVLTAANGVEALAIARHEGAAISLIISDNTMPRMGGGELLRALKVEGLHIPFALTTGDPEPDGDPAIPVIPKPWTVGELLAGVSTILAQEREA